MAKITGGMRKGGKRSKTRSKLKNKRGKVTVNQVMEEFEEGAKVQVVIRPNYHAGIPSKGFHGLTGYISGKRGDSYEIELKKGNKDMLVVTTPVHIKRLE